MSDEPVSAENGTEARPNWRHRKGDQYVVLFGDWITVGTYGQPDYDMVQCWAWLANQRVFNARHNAARAGIQWQGSDDFNIGVLRGGKLVALLWMEEVVDDDPDLMAQIQEDAAL